MKATKLFVTTLGTVAVCSAIGLTYAQSTSGTMGNQTPKSVNETPGPKGDMNNPGNNVDNGTNSATGSMNMKRNTSRNPAGSAATTDTTTSGYTGSSTTGNSDTDRMSTERKARAGRN